MGSRRNVANSSPLSTSREKSDLGRGVTRYELGDKQGALADYNQALKLNPNYADAYYGRGLTYRDMGDKQNAIADFEKAAELYKQQGQQDKLQQALDQLKRLRQ